MKLGIDFGTTRIVVAAVDRGNYPVIAFEDADGAAREWFPPLLASRGGVRIYGWNAWAVQSDPEWTVVRSLKRTLEDAGPYTEIMVDGEAVPLTTLLSEMVASLRSALLETSSLPSHDARFEAMLGVPANANTNQRFLTVEPFQRAGFEVLGLLNEPSAASIEYGHANRHRGALEQVLVYDLGGGTFDASLVRLEDQMHTVVASEGISDLGGDDFDQLLADMALEHADIGSLTQSETFRLHEECRAKKEALHPNTRRIVIDFGQVREGLEQVGINISDFYDRCRPLVDRTIERVNALLGGERADALYVTGGGSELPLVSRMLKEAFGRRVKRSAYTRSATAIGLAIQADVQAGYTLRESFNRHFGVWREGDAGSTVTFDPLFAKGTLLPGPSEAPLTITRRYAPAHNLAHFRYLECSHLSDDGKPRGDIAVWDEIRFPLDPALADARTLDDVDVERSQAAASQEVEERYTVGATGAVQVSIENLTAGYRRAYKLGRWAPKAAPVTPGRKKRARVESHT